MKKAVVVGATSGIGKEVAKLLVKQGWRVGIAGRRREALEELKSTDPSKFVIQQLDVNQDDAVDNLHLLIDKLGGMDLYFNSSGIGSQNSKLDPEIELNTLRTNGEGFTRMITTAFHYFKRKGKGHIAIISSIAGTKGIGVAPAYSATKRFQNTYIQALSQLAHMQKLPVIFTDIRPGFVDTDLLKGGNYPLMMEPGYVAEKIVKAINRKKRVAIIDWRYSILVFFWRLIPGWLWERIKVTNK